MKRETSAYERVMFYYSNKGPMFFAFRMNIHGELSEEALRTALGKVRTRYPLSAVRVEKLADKRQFITTDDVPGYPLVIKNNFSGHWSDEVSAALQAPFDNEKGPMVRFVLLKNGLNNDLIAVFQHSVVDGVGALVFLEDLISFICNPSLEAKAPGDDEWAPMLHKLIAQETLEKIKAMPAPPYVTDKAYTKFEIKEHAPEPFPVLSFALHTAVFSEAQTSRAIELAKQSGVTVHSYLGALLLQCFAEHLGPESGYERTIQSPINFRPQLVQGSARTFGLFNGLLKAKCDCSESRTTADIAREIGETFHNEIAGLKPLAGYYNFMTYLLEGIDDPELFYENRPGGSSPMDYDFSFSNLGRLSLEKQFGDLTLEEIHGPTFSATKGERVIGLLTYQGKMFMTMIYDSNCFDKVLGEKIFATIENRIKSL